MLKRRDFLEAGIVAGAGLVLASSPVRAATDSNTLNVALLGAGAQGRTLMQAALLIPGIRFVAVCDIWKYSRNSARNYLSTYKQDAADYADYQEMLEKRRGSRR